MVTLERRIAEHSYKNGARYHVTPLGELPGVTTITGKTCKFDFSIWRANNPEESARTIKRGLTLHEAIEGYLIERRPSDHPLFGMALEILDNIELVVWEHQVFSEFGYSGSLDALGYWGGQLTLFDWKGSTRSKTSSQVTDYLLQVSAYQKALEECDGIKAERCCVVVLPEDANQCQVFELRQEHIDYYFYEFLGRLDEYNYQYS
jgi:hypothetical protein